VKSRWWDRSIQDARHAVGPVGPKGRWRVWNARRGNHRGQRSRTAPTDPMICGAGGLGCAISAIGSPDHVAVIQQCRTRPIRPSPRVGYRTQHDKVLAAQVPGLPQTKAKRTIESDKLALQSAIDGYRARAAAAGHPADRVVATYEAGWSGFCLARWLIGKGIAVHVMQPASVPVDWRMRRATSDRSDAELLLRTLLAWLRGEPRGCSMGPIPDEADEDARRCVGERTELVAERVALANRIGAVLATLGSDPCVNGHPKSAKAPSERQLGSSMWILWGSFPPRPSSPDD
jgi:hypothetical protein